MFCNPSLCKIVLLLNVNVLAPSVGDESPIQVASPDSAILITWPFALSNMKHLYLSSLDAAS